MRDYNQTGETHDSNFIMIDAKNGGQYLKAGDDKTYIKGFAGYINSVNLYHDEGNEEHRIEPGPVLRVECESKDPTGKTDQIGTYIIDVPLRYPIAGPRIINNLAKTCTKGQDHLWNVSFYKKDGKDSLYSYSKINGSREQHLEFDQETSGFKGSPRKNEDAPAYYQFWTDIIRKYILPVFDGGEISNPKQTEDPEYARFRKFTLNTLDAIDNFDLLKKRLKDAKSGYEMKLTNDQCTALYLLWEEKLHTLDPKYKEWKITNGEMQTPQEVDDDLPF